MPDRLVVVQPIHYHEITGPQPLHRFRQPFCIYCRGIGMQDMRPRCISKRFQRRIRITRPNARPTQRIAACTEISLVPLHVFIIKAHRHHHLRLGMVGETEKELTHLASHGICLRKILCQTFVGIIRVMLIYDVSDEAVSPRRLYSEAPATANPTEPYHSAY
ncbi:MAG: hypothetical protein PUD56_03365 [Prevotella sp.]|nr:hypothetical protein [Prevotella sp.]